MNGKFNFPSGKVIFPVANKTFVAVSAGKKNQTEQNNNKEKNTAPGVAIIFLLLFYFIIISIYYLFLCKGKKLQIIEKI